MELCDKMNAQRAEFEQHLNEGFEEAYQMLQEKEAEIATLKKEVAALKNKAGTTTVTLPKVDPVYGKQGQWSIYKQPDAPKEDYAKWADRCQTEWPEHNNPYQKKSDPFVTTD